MIKSKKLRKLKNINHGFFNRKGGKSTGIYKSLNCGPGSKDKKKNIKKNLQIVKNYFNKKFKADAIITNQKNLPIGILTADCVPILIHDNVSKVIAAIHAGWRGAYKGIINKVIKFMIKKGSKRKNIYAAIGPCISQESYNVKMDFFEKFIKKTKKNKIFFKKRKKVLFFDLPKYVKSELKFNKITKIDHININTFDKKNNFFSARRALKLKHDDYGRNISIIMIN